MTRTYTNIVYIPRYSNIVYILRYSNIVYIPKVPGTVYEHSRTPCHGRHFLLSSGHIFIVSVADLMQLTLLHQNQALCYMYTYLVHRELATNGTWNKYYPRTVVQYISPEAPIRENALFVYSPPCRGIRTLESVGSPGKPYSVSPPSTHG